MDNFRDERGDSPQLGVGAGDLVDAAFGGLWDSTVVESEKGDLNRVVNARGTEDGLVLRIDGSAPWAEVLRGVEEYLGGRRKFFDGGEVSIEWLERLPSKESCAELERLLQVQYGLTISHPRRKALRGSGGAAQSTEAQIEDGGKPLAGKSSVRLGTEKKSVPGSSSLAGGADMRAFDLVEQIEKMASGEGFLGEDFDSNIFQESKHGTERVSSDLLAGDGYHLERGMSTRSGRSDSGRSDSGRSDSGRSDSGRSDSSRSDSSRGDSSRGEFGERYFAQGGVQEHSRRQLAQVRRSLGDELFLEEEANCRIVFGTVRSGQKIETPFSLVIVGDVNPGADLISGGNIIVLGSLRGTAHASAYDEDAFESVIIAMQMQPMQLRIGAIISRGSDELCRGAEIARIENRRIIVEPFNSRVCYQRAMSTR